MERDLKNCNGCICPKRPTCLFLYRNLDDKISSETLITFTLENPSNNLDHKLSLC